MSTTATAELFAFQRDTEALSQISGRLGWDQETVMPPGAADQRAEEISALEGLLHARRTDPRLKDLLDAASPATEAEAAQIREIRHSYEREVKIPESLARSLAALSSRAQGIWVAARAADDVKAFLPTLSEMIRLKREEAACLAAGGDLYDALLDDYEPGAKSADLAAMFDRMRPRLVALRERVLDRPAPEALAGHFPAEMQLRLSREMAEAFGYDFNRGRLDLAVHPFSSGSGQDVRITTRVDERDPLNCFYSTIHETGHGAYEQQVDAHYTLTAIGKGASMGVHESQSRICENQLGRSEAWTSWLFARLSQEMTLNIGTARDFYRAVNRVSPGFIRTEADELHYNLHIMLRFDLERALIAGDLAPADLEAAWNDRFKADFGVEVPRPSLGMLQDVHWSCGLFGYFPTYSLGNVYAGCLHQALRQEVPQLDASLAQGSAAPATAWLRDGLRRHGALRTPVETLRHACGFAPDEAPLLAYLEAKFSDLYTL
ncbi:carboxypeptidase M32 [Falsigemmobacter faecalis]|uniref:Metal-dependent carboxypeptidase n=1 Tax=Falsigemmobacter faecalis TaxID=2488730 RepID=A0A3P3DQR1_9RHOB|nr:carboxypeptidase M32 [Falsigemmobacter faecalis]RRH76555.1 carboxypeptidase M32 [Falsigemmobacter faecalis]